MFQQVFKMGRILASLHVSGDGLDEATNQRKTQGGGCELSCVKVEKISLTARDSAFTGSVTCHDMMMINDPSRA